MIKFFLSLDSFLKFIKGSTRPMIFNSEKLNSDFIPSASSFGPPTPYKLTDVFFFISFIRSAPSLSPECSPQTIPILRESF